MQRPCRWSQPRNAGQGPGGLGARGLAGRRAREATNAASRGPSSRPAGPRGFVLSPCARGGR
eukprot:10053919-Lingulodinium_polyedra.AAC.1